MLRLIVNSFFTIVGTLLDRSQLTERKPFLGLSAHSLIADRSMSYRRVSRFSGVLAPFGSPTTFYEIYPTSVNVYAVFATFRQSKVELFVRATNPVPTVLSDPTDADNAPQMA